MNTDKTNKREAGSDRVQYLCPHKPFSVSEDRKTLTIYFKNGMRYVGKNGEGFNTVFDKAFQELGLTKSA